MVSGDERRGTCGTGGTHWQCSRESLTRTAAIAVLLVSLAALAGCSGAPFGGGGSGTPAASSPAPASESPVSTATRAGGESSGTTGTDSNGETTDRPATTAEGSTATAAPGETPTDAATATATPTPTATPVPAPTLSEVGVDPNATLDRVEALLNVSIERPSIGVKADTSVTSAGPAARILVGEQGSNETGSYAAEYEYSPSGPGRVVFNATYLRTASPSNIEMTLAHEFTHAYQFQHLDRWNIDPDFASPIAGAAFIEGSAEFAAIRYGARYMNRSVDARTADLERYFANRTTHQRFGLAVYVYGQRWTERTLDSPANFSTLPEDHPETTEELLHGTEEEPERFSYLPANDIRWDLDTTTRGELWTRIVLRDELNRSTAATAADGWGNDKLATYERANGSTGVVWTHRWETTADADEFEAAMRKHLAHRRGETDEYAFEIRRLGSKMTVVVAGHPEFVDAVSVSGSNDRVEHEIEENEE